jgi:hypothetical protein
MQPATANLRSPGYYLAHARAPCGHCNESSRVIALALPEGHEARVEGHWQLASANAFIFDVAELSGPVSRRLAQVAPLFSRKQGEGRRNPYWANHCEHCGSMFSDEALHCEPGGFMPTQPSEAQAIELSHVAEEFSAAAAGYALDPEFFSLIRRR